VKKSTLLPLLATLLLTPALATAAPGGRVGFVELARVLRESKAAGAFREKLEADLKERQAAVNAEKAKLDALEAEYAKAEKTATEAQKQARQKELQEKSAALQKRVADARKEVTDADQASTKSVVELMNSVLTKIAESKGYDLVVEKAGASVLYGRRGVDLTDEVIRQMDALK
jgi:outer membrane protein